MIGRRHPWARPAAAVAACLALALGGGAPPASAHPAELGRDALAAADGRLWLAVRTHGTLVHLDAAGRVVGEPARAGRGPIAVAAAGDRLWVADYDGAAVLRLDARTGRRVGAPIAVAAPAAIAVGARGVWIADYAGDAVVRIDRSSGRVTRRVRVDRGPVAVALSGRSLWVASAFGASVSRLDADTGRLLDRVASPHPQDLAAGEGAIWVANRPGAVLRIDPATGGTSAVALPGSTGADGVAVGAGSVWATNEGEGRVFRIDPASGRVDRTVRSHSPAAVAPLGRALYVADGELATISQIAAGPRGRVRQLSDAPLAGPPEARLERPAAPTAAAGAASPGPAQQGDGGPPVGLLAGVAAALVAAGAIAAVAIGRRRGGPGA